MPSPQATAYQLLSDFARRNGLPVQQFTFYNMALLWWESTGFNPRADIVRPRGQRGPNDPGENSHGLPQLNLDVHPISLQCAEDPVCSVSYWLQNQGHLRAWAHCSALYNPTADPTSFMSCYAPTLQISDPWDPSIVSRSLAGATAAVAQATAELGLSPDQPAPSPTPSPDGIGLGPIHVPLPSIPNPGIPIPDIPNPFGGVPNPIGGIQDAAGIAGDIWGKLRDWHFWAAAALAVVGVGVLFIGIFAVIPQSVKEDAAGVAGAAAKGGV